MWVGKILGISAIVGILAAPVVLYIIIKIGQNEKRMSEKKDYDDWE